MAALLALAAAASSCAWRRVEPASPEPAGQPRLDEVVGLAGADEDTSLQDLRSLSRIWTRWGSFRKVQFPYREGDPVDLVIELRLRQSTEVPRIANTFKTFAVGFSLFTLSPVLGPSVSELHDVELTCRRGAERRAPLRAVIRSDVEFGCGASGEIVARELDERQMELIAARVLAAVATGCRPPP
ncbi:MAG: hypothetical protein HZB56_08020 [Deltaproteobacteria bacterium]|nr:hypothetical protein [Deltaproteobacteria bacterium]